MRHGASQKELKAGNARPCHSWEERHEQVYHGRGRGTFSGCVTGIRADLAEPDCNHHRALCARWNC